MSQYHVFKSWALFLITFALILAGCDEGVSTSQMASDNASGDPSLTSNANEEPDSSLGALPDTAKVIPGSYIVVFNKGAVANIPQQAQSLAAAHGGEVHAAWSKVLQGFAVRNIPEAAASALERNPQVKYVEPEVIGQLAVRDNVGSSHGQEWGLDRIDQRSGVNGLYLAGAEGVNVSAYVLDSGIRVSHYAFGGRASHGWDFIDNDSNADDCHGHGTHVAGTIGANSYGVARDVDIVSVRVADCAGFVPTSALVNGLEWVVTNHGSGKAVINMSLGAPPTSSWDDATQTAIDLGYTVVVAAGNDNSNACNVSPARVPDAITVGATDINDRRATFPSGRRSNYGSCIDLFAPGDEILSLGIGSNNDTHVLSGTSMAAPHVAGAAALYLENNPHVTPIAVRNAIYQYSTKNVVSDSRSANNHLLYSLLNHPRAPSNLSASCVPDDTPRLNWTASPSGDVDYYIVERSTYSGGGYSQIGTSQTTSYNDTYVRCAGGGNTDGARYYRALAVDNDGLRSGQSNYDGVLITNDPPWSSPSPTADSLSITSPR